jgi:probable F420-dependent oxidoreductase
MSTNDRILDELGYYLLPGAGGKGPAGVMDEARRGEELGLGTAFISERWNLKETTTISAAACAVTTRLRVATAATNHNTRHPLITASWATTLHRLSGGRFTLGIGRGVPGLYDMFGIPNITTAQMEEFANVMRTLWHGGVLVNHDGQLGKYRTLYLDGEFDEDIPLAIVAFGPNTLKLGGRAFDHVILHTYFSPETLQRCVRTVKEAAEQAGRNPDDVKVWSCLATVGDHLPESVRRNKLIGRLATYLQGYGDLMVRTNDWDPAVLQRFRDDPVVQSIPGAIDRAATDEQLRHIEEILPAEWTQHAATGTPEQCAARVRAELGYGADKVILHGALPDELEPVLAAYRALELASA